MSTIFFLIDSGYGYFSKNIDDFNHNWFYTRKPIVPNSYYF